MQTVQRAGLWSVILALQSSDAVHVGVGNLGVVRHVGRLLGDCSFAAPLELVTDGDLLIRRMLDLRGRDTVRVTKVKGHADEGMVFDGRVRELDRLGNNAADKTADFGRRSVGNAVIDARCNLSGFVDGGILLFLIFIGSSLPFLGPLLITMGLVGLLLIRWSGLLVLCPRGGLFMLFVILLCLGLPIRVQFWCSLDSNLSGQLICHLVVSYTHDTSLALQIVRTRQCVVMKYCPTSTVFRNPASIQTFFS